MPARLTLIAHAATMAQRRAAFPLDEPVDERELAKIAALSWSAPAAQHILAAPERRTQQTAHALGLLPAAAMELHDCDYGTWRGRGIAEVQTGDPEGIAAWLTDTTAAPHGGESIESLTRRVGGWMEEQRDAGHVIAVTHPAVVRSAIVHALQSPLQAFWRVDVAPLTLTDIRFNGRVWTMRCAACSLRKPDQREVDGGQAE